MPAAKGASQDPAAFARHQARAARYPRAFRLQLTLLAVAGDAALTAAIVLPWALPIAFGALFFNVELFYWVGGGATLFLAWVFRPSFRLEGRELRKEDAPVLFADIDELRQKLGVARGIRILLDDSLNAGAVETRGYFGLLGTRRTLLLGIPLLLALSRQDVLAVIAHELGHFSRRHGLLGHWLYRARVGWIEFGEFVTESDSAFDRAAAWYARHFLAYFGPRSFVLSRQCEYEADADAAAVAGAANIAHALARIAVVDAYRQGEFARDMATWQRLSPRPPQDFHERFGALVRELPQERAAQWLEEALRAPSSWQDTHPGLAERLRALRRKPTLAASCGDAGATFFRDRWPSLLAEFSAAWALRERGAWLLEHAWLTVVAQPFLDASPAEVAAMDPAASLARGRVLRILQPAEGLRALQELCARHPQCAAGKFAFAAALLAEGDATGCAMLEELARSNLPLRLPAFERIAAFYARRGDDANAERWETWRQQAYRRQADAVAQVLAQVEAGVMKSSALQGPARHALAVATRLDPSIAGAWLIEDRVDVRLAESKPPVPLTVQVLVLRVDAGETARVNEQESQIAERYRRFMQRLLAPDVVPAVLTYFTTETLPASLAENPGLRLDAAKPAES